MNLNKLHEAIESVCPIHGVSVGDVNDKNTWVISFKDEATSEQKAAAQLVIDSVEFSILEDVKYIPARTVFERLVAINKAEVVIGALTQIQLVNFLTLKEGIAVNDSEVIALLTSIGVDPGTILY